MTGPSIQWRMPHEDTAGISDRHQRVPAPAWPDGWPVPRIGDRVVTGDSLSLEVTWVGWWPHGVLPGDDPFVEVVLK